MIPPGTTPEQLEAAIERWKAAQEQRVREPAPDPTPERVRLRLYSAPIAEAEALGESVDEALNEIQDAGERCAKPPDHPVLSAK